MRPSTSFEASRSCGSSRVASRRSSSFRALRAPHERRRRPSGRREREGRRRDVHRESYGLPGRRRRVRSRRRLLHRQVPRRGLPPERELRERGRGVHVTWGLLLRIVRGEPGRGRDLPRVLPPRWRGLHARARLLWPRVPRRCLRRRALRKDGDACTETVDCCAGTCVGAKCQRDELSTCRPTGEDCNTGSPRPCCGGACSKENRCAYGAGPCLAPGTVCLVGADCCGGTCAPDARGVTVCQVACAVEGASCSATAACCSGVCSGTPGVCAPRACKTAGDACARAEECCTGVCDGGRCAASCP